MPDTFQKARESVIEARADDLHNYMVSGDSNYCGGLSELIRKTIRISVNMSSHSPEEKEHVLASMNSRIDAVLKGTSPDLIRYSEQDANLDFMDGSAFLIMAAKLTIRLYHELRPSALKEDFSEQERIRRLIFLRKYYEEKDKILFTAENYFGLEGFDRARDGDREWYYGAVAEAFNSDPRDYIEAHRIKIISPIDFLRELDPISNFVENCRQNPAIFYLEGVDELAVQLKKFARETITHRLRMDLNHVWEIDARPEALEKMLN